jgi:hypothetical protein
MNEQTISPIFGAIFIITTIVWLVLFGFGINFLNEIREYMKYKREQQERTE